jgi:hypothetical protein
LSSQFARHDNTSLLKSLKMKWVHLGDNIADYR